jgi:hypothetical protein
MFVTEQPDQFTIYAGIICIVFALLVLVWKFVLKDLYADFMRLYNWRLDNEVHFLDDEDFSINVGVTYRSLRQQATRTRGN